MKPFIWITYSRSTIKIKSGFYFVFFAVAQQLVFCLIVTLTGVQVRQRLGKKMQTRAKKVYFQFAECSFSYERKNK